MCIRDSLEGALVPYVHGGGKIGVMVQFDTDCADKDGFVACGKDIAMQVAAAAPQYLSKEEVPSEVVDKEKEILTAQAINCLLYTSQNIFVTTKDMECFLFATT